MNDMEDVLFALIWKYIQCLKTLKHSKFPTGDDLKKLL